MAQVLITGGTGYMGQRLIPRLLERGHRVRAVVRPGSEKKLCAGCDPVPGDALAGKSYAGAAAGCDTLVHLVGTPHPAPWKAGQFRAVDRVSALEAIRVARERGIGNFVYLSVAHPAPTMHAYIAVRRECEDAIREAGLNAHILRPWYVLGPGHLWPYALLPFYKVAENIPTTREGALRLGLVTLEQMVNALAWAVDHPGHGVRVIGVPEIRAGLS